MREARRRRIIHGPSTHSAGHSKSTQTSRFAHNLYTYLEVELGGASDATYRLLNRARHHPADAEVFAGLVHACRYCGLLDSAIAAYEIARQLDPQIRTSVAHAYWMRGDYQAAIRTDIENPPFTTINALIASGREREAMDRLVVVAAAVLPPGMKRYFQGVRALLEGRRADAVAAIQALRSAGPVRDPCGRYYLARCFARLGQIDWALEMLRSAVEGGFFCRAALERDAWLDPLRGMPAFTKIAVAASARQDAAERRFHQAGGNAVLHIEHSQT